MLVDPFAIAWNIQTYRVTGLKGDILGFDRRYAALIGLMCHKTTITLLSKAIVPEGFAISWRLSRHL